MCFQAQLAPQPMWLILTMSLVFRILVWTCMVEVKWLWQEVRHRAGPTYNTAHLEWLSRSGLRLKSYTKVTTLLAVLVRPKKGSVFISGVLKEHLSSLCTLQMVDFLPSQQQRLVFLKLQLKYFIYWYFLFENIFTKICYVYITKFKMFIMCFFTWKSENNQFLGYLV